MELINILMDQLGVSEEQASGGAGLLFKLAKDKIGGADFSQIADAVPGVDNLISSAPESGGFAGALGGLTSSLGGGAGKLGDLASLAGGFKSLGLDSGMLNQFIPVVLSFVQSKGGDTVKALFEKVME